MEPIFDLSPDLPTHADAPRRPAPATTIHEWPLVTGFTRGEDEVDALFAYMPFSLEDWMRAEGAQFVEPAPLPFHTETDGRLMTGRIRLQPRQPHRLLTLLTKFSPGQCRTTPRLCLFSTHDRAERARE